jgi:hypothetical protein
VLRLTKLLLAGVAVLSLLSTAHASMCHQWRCGRLLIGACVVKHIHAVEPSPSYDYEVSIEGLPNPRIRLNFKFEPTDWTASLNGKACKTYERPSEP